MGVPIDFRRRSVLLPRTILLASGFRERHLVESIRTNYPSHLFITGCWFMCWAWEWLPAL